MRVEIGLKEIKEAANRIKKFINRTSVYPHKDWVNIITEIYI